MYGAKGEVWARMTGDFAVRFDYKAEVDEARKAFPAMMVDLGLDKPKEPPAGKKPPAPGPGKTPAPDVPEPLPEPGPILPDP